MGARRAVFAERRPALSLHDRPRATRSALHPDAQHWIGIAMQETGLTDCWKREEHKEA